MGKIFDIKHFAVHDGPGIRTTVFLKGCPLKCRWCHNPESISPKFQIAWFADKCVECQKCATVCPNNVHVFHNGHSLAVEDCSFCGKCEAICPRGALSVYGKEVTVSDILPALLEDREFYETSGGGVTLSGGECLMQADFCVELLQKVKEYGIHTAVDTCGFVSKEVLDKVIPYTDLFLYDMKAYDEDVHIRCTGRSNGQILENLKYLDGLGKQIEIRIPYVPEYNADQMEKIAKFLAELKHITKIRILPYHNYAGSKYGALTMKNTLPDMLPDDEEIAQARKLIKNITNIEVSA